MISSNQEKSLSSLRDFSILHHIFIFIWYNKEGKIEV